MDWPSSRFLGVWDGGSVRRGFEVFTKSCANCHGMMFRKYDVLLDKAYN